MSDRKIHLGAVPYGTGGPGSHTLWLDPEIPGDASVSVDWFTEMARLAEQGKFDLVFIVDSQFITPHSPPHYLNRLEPLTLLSALATQTNRIGLVGTATTSFNSPFNLARRFGSPRPHQRRPGRLERRDHRRRRAPRATTGSTSTTTTTPATAGPRSSSSSPARCGTPTRTTRSSATASPASSSTASKQHVARPRGRVLQGRAARSTSQRSRAGPPGDLPGRRLRPGPRPRAPASARASSPTPRTSRAGRRSTTTSRAGPRDRFGRDPDHLVIMPGIKVVARRHRRGGPRDRGRNNDARPHLRRRARGVRPPVRLARLHASTTSTRRSPSRHSSTASGRSSPRPRSHPARPGQRLDPAPGRRGHPRLPQERVRRLRPTVADKLVEWWEARACDGFNIGVDHPANFRRVVDEVVPLLQERGVFRRRLRLRPTCAAISVCPCRSTVTPQHDRSTCPAPPDRLRPVPTSSRLHLIQPDRE